MTRAFQNTVAVILAGGLGTRVRHLLPDVPKPMAPVAGRPFIEWVVRYLAAHGIQRIVISAGFKAEIIAGHFAEPILPDLQVQCVAEPQPLGTAGGFVYAARASGQIPDHWLVLNGDSLVFADPGLLAPLCASPEITGAIFGINVPDASRYGSLAIDSAGTLTGFNEKRSGRGMISAGVYLLSQRAVEPLPSGTLLSFERDVFPQWIKDKRAIKVVPVTAPFLDIGTEATLAQADEFVRANAGQFAV